MVICTSITKSYLEKSQPFFTSVKENFDGKRICFTIGFKTKIDGWETVQVQPECKWQPTNRKDFYTLQHGEFIKHYQFDPEEMVLFLDSDMVLQREFDLEFPATDAVLVTACSYPQLKMCEVIKNIGIKKNRDKFYDKYKIFLQREFCACWILCKAKTWEKIYEGSKKRYSLLYYFDHHAAWQLLINCVVHNDLKAYLLPDHICNAEWYEGTAMKDGNVGEEVVYFNHTKFN